MKVFISSPHQDKMRVEMLRKQLSDNNVSVSSAAEHFTSSLEWHNKVQKKIKAADAIILLIDPHHRRDRCQEFEWQAALEAHWADYRKRLIPFLLSDAELPGFLSKAPTIRVQDPDTEWDQAIDTLLHLLRDTPPAPIAFLSMNEADLERRRTRLESMEAFAHTLKTR